MPKTKDQTEAGTLSSLKSCLYLTISGKEAEEILMGPEGKDGSFLVRRSTSAPGEFSVSARVKNKVEHCGITYKDDVYDIDGKEMFPTLSAMILYMMKFDGLRKKDESWIRFIHPLYADVTPDETWFHGNIKSVTAERLLIENGQVGAFLVGISHSKCTHFVLHVLADIKKVIHIMISRDDNKNYVIDGTISDSLKKLIDYQKKHPICQVVDGQDKEIKLSIPCNATLFRAIDTADRLVHMQAEHSLVQEFESLLKADLPGSTAYGAQLFNKPKNRYKNILPFDHTRVKLKCVDSKELGSDYINASYVDNIYETRELRTCSKIKYIAAQGCLPKTRAQFWEMIWQEQVSVVAMTTRETEEGKFKCARYWPDEEGFDETLDTFGDKINLKMEYERQHPSYMERKIIMTRGKKSRNVYHFHFVVWPDHGVPEEPGILLEFIDNVNAKQRAVGKKKPLLIHCSAGIGRTGTVIVLDIIMHQLRELGLGCRIDVLETCKLARRQRPGLIQTPQQYEFIYAALARYVEVKRSFLKDQENKPSEQTYNNVESLRNESEGKEPIYEEMPSIKGEAAGAKALPPLPES